MMKLANNCFFSRAIAFPIFRSKSMRFPFAKDTLNHLLTQNLNRLLLKFVAADRELCTQGKLVSNQMLSRSVYTFLFSRYATLLLDE